MTPLSMSSRRFTVLLVNPNRMQPPIAPIALDYLADTLIERGMEVHLLDLCWAQDWRAAIDEHFDTNQADLIAFSVRNTDDCYFASGQSFIGEYAEMIAHLRQHTSSPIAVGGVGYSLMPEALLRTLGADVGVVGDGELAVAELAVRLRHHGDWTTVPGVVHTEGDGIRCNPPDWLDPAALPPRRRAMADNDRYHREGGQGGFEVTRGCAMKCIYCADPVARGRQVRARSPEQVADEIEALLAQGVDHLHTCDSEFNLLRDHAADVCRAIIARRLGDRVRWYAYCSPRPFDDELAGLMAQAGCVGINFGVDAGDDGQLRRLGRDFTVADLESAAEACWRHGIVIMYDLLIGGPGETPDTVQTTIDTMRRIAPDRVGMSVGVRIYPDTPIAEAVLAGGQPGNDPNLRGSLADNPNLLDPVFYMSAELGDDPIGLVREMVRGDRRFFTGADPETGQDYNYNQNQVLIDAIRAGHRGAYWDILRRLADE
jgi:radical SAM superfamily enzyme YgiQ (UPF0313 family)